MYSIDQLANLFGKSRRAIYHYMEQGIISADARKKFSEEEVDKLRDHLDKRTLLQTTHYTVNECAKLLGVSYPVAKQYFEMQGMIEIHEVGRVKNVVPREWFHENEVAIKEYIAKNHPERLKVYENEIRLFDRLNFRGAEVLVLSVNPPQLWDGLNHHYPKGKLDIISAPPRRTSQDGRQGPIEDAVVFEISRELPFESSVYDAVSRLIEHLGEKNVQVYKTSTLYRIHCRKSKVPYDALYEVLSGFQVRGNLYADGDWVLLGEYLQTVPVQLPYTVFRDLEKKLKPEGKTIQALTLELLTNFLEQKKGQGG